MTPVQIKSIVSSVYASRKARDSHPDGETDKAGRWYPSAREDAEGDGSSTRSPSRAWPWSYMSRCRTRQHCAVLVERALAGLDVPRDVALAVAQVVALQPAPAEIAA